MYGGLTKKDPIAFPGNSRTGLAVGDVKRISLLFLFMTIMNAITCVFVPWYEAWGTDDAWESGDYFDGIVENIKVESLCFHSSMRCNLHNYILYFKESGTCKTKIA